MLTEQSQGREVPSIDDLAAIRAFNTRARARHWAFTCFAAGDFERAELAAAFATWTDKAGARRMPARSDITARTAKSWMPHMSLLERVDEESGPRYRVRLHGSALTRYGGDSTGRYLDEFVHGGRIHSYTAVYDLVLAQLVPLRVLSRYQAPDISYLIGESFVAPLSRPEASPLVLSVTFTKPRTELSDR